MRIILSKTGYYLRENLIVILFLISINYEKLKIHLTDIKLVFLLVNSCPYPDGSFILARFKSTSTILVTKWDRIFVITIRYYLMLLNKSIALPVKIFYSTYSITSKCYLIFIMSYCVVFKDKKVTRLVSYQIFFSINPII
jgi:hypothetical protein